MDGSAAYYIARMSKVITEVTADVNVDVEADVQVETEVKSKRTKKPNVEKVEKVEKLKTVKTKVDKYNGFKVPDKKIPSTRWASYVYNMITEAKPSLLQMDDVRTTYNKMVECLRKYGGLLESYIPTKYYKYHNSRIYLDDNIFDCHVFRWISDNYDYNNPRPNENRKKKLEFIVEFADVYTLFFNLIRRDIIPYMELKQHEINSKQQIERCHYQMKRVENNIKMYESRIADQYKELGKLSEEVIKCGAPPKLTVFE